MKQLLLSLFIVGCTTIPVDPTPTPSPTPEPNVVLRNDAGPTVSYGPAVNDLERCQYLRDAMKLALPKATITLSAGKFDCDGKNKGALLFAPDITVIGAGMDKTHLVSNNWSDAQGAGFESRGGVIESLTLENQPWQNHEDGRTLQFWDGYAKTADGVNYLKDASGQLVWENRYPGPFTGTLKKVKVIANDWAIYDWSYRQHKWIISDSVIVSGRQGLSLMNNNLNAITAIVNDTHIDIDTDRSNSFGWTSNAVHGGGYGMVNRGGNLEAYNTTISVKCGKHIAHEMILPRCAGLFDGHNFGSTTSASSNVLDGVWVKVEGRGSPEAYDVFMTNPGTREKLKATNCVGTAGGALVLNPLK